jgi:hypothetical protein
VVSVALAVVPDGMVESAKGVFLEFLAVFIILDGGFTGNDDLSLNAREGLGENGDGCRFLVFARDGRKGFVLLAYISGEAFGPSQIFGRVSPDIQGFLRVWGSGCSDVWGSRWGGRGSFVGSLAMWFVVGCSGELLAHFLEFGSDAR